MKEDYEMHLVRSNRYPSNRITENTSPRLTNVNISLVEENESALDIQNMTNT